MDQDEIRRKRLAALARFESKTPKESRKASPAASQVSGNPPTDQPSQLSQSDDAGTEDTIMEDADASATAPAPPVATPAPAAPPPVTIEDWTHRELERLLKITLDSQKDSADLAFLPSLSADKTAESSESSESEQSGESANPVRLTLDDMDEILMERLEMPFKTPETRFTYLVGCYGRAKQGRRFVSANDPLAKEKSSFYQLSSKVLARYGMLLLTEPEMFSSQTSVITSVVDQLIRNSSEDRDFFTAITESAAEDSALPSLLEPIVEVLTLKFRETDMSQSYSPLLAFFLSLFNSKAVVETMCDLPGVFPAPGVTSASELEQKCLLGLVLRLSPLSEKIAAYHFGTCVDAGSNPIQLRTAMESLQVEYAVVLNDLFFVVNKIVRSSERSRNRLLRYFAQLANANHRRRAMQVDRRAVSSDGLMINVCHVLTRLSQPFLDASYAKIDKIDRDFFRRSDLLDISEETKLGVDQEAAAAYYSADNPSTVEARAAGEPNFISNVFYLCAAFHHYGLGALAARDDQIQEEMKAVERQVESLRKAKENAAAAGQMRGFAALAGTMLPRLEKRLSELKSLLHALRAFFVMETTQNEFFDFAVGMCVFLVRTVDPTHSYPKHKPVLPLDDSEPQKIGFCYLPEYMVEIVSGYCLYISKYALSPLVAGTGANPKLNALLDFTVVILRTRGLVKNPHLKSSLVQLLFYGAMDTPRGTPGFMMTLLDTNELALQHLFRALMSFYIDAEFTGGNNQFYEKFNIRYYISEIMIKVWANHTYRKRLEQEWKGDKDFFVRFVALALNDTTYLLDESLTKLTEIHNLQLQLEDPNRRNSETEQNEEGEPQDLEARLASYGSQARSLIQLGNKTIQLLGLFTASVPRAFIIPEVSDRLAAMLDYNLAILVGPKCRELKVKEPEKYGFQPRNLLKSLLNIYLNLSKFQEFVEATARDERSFSVNLFTRARDILTKHGLATPAFCNQLVAFAESVERVLEEAAQQEEDLGEIPDEFLDPLMFTLMENPVTLPGSKVDIDLSTIKTHLLSTATDPFNRMPLKLEDVVPNVELKRRIEEFKRNHSRKKKSDAGLENQETGGAEGSEQQKDGEEASKAEHPSGEVEETEQMDTTE